MAHQEGMRGGAAALKTEVTEKFASCVQICSRNFEPRMPFPCSGFASCPGSPCWPPQDLMDWNVFRQSNLSSGQAWWSSSFVLVE